jgi:hypothetical protein
VDRRDRPRRQHPAQEGRQHDPDQADHDHRDREPVEAPVDLVEGPAEAERPGAGRDRVHAHAAARDSDLLERRRPVTGCDAAGSRRFRQATDAEPGEDGPVLVQHLEVGVGEQRRVGRLVGVRHARGRCRPDDRGRRHPVSLFTQGHVDLPSQLVADREVHGDRHANDRHEHGHRRSDRDPGAQPHAARTT